MNKSNHILTLIVAVIALGLGACTANSDKPTLSGVLETDDLDIVSPYTGQILTINVSEGEQVEAGDTVAIIDTVTAAAAYRAARAAVTQAGALLADLEAGSDVEKIRAAEARLRLAEETLTQTAKDAQRSKKLHAEHLIDDRTLEEANLAYANASAAREISAEELADLRRGARVDQLAAARAALTRTQEELALAEKAYQDAFLISKHSGVVQILPYQVGEYAPAGKAVARLKAADNLWAMIYVPEDKLDQVEVGQELSFQVDAHPGQTFAAKVVYISSEAEFTPRNVQTADERLNLVFQVKVSVMSDKDISDKDLSGKSGLRAGMPADFSLE